jgi:hypothetical protein
MLAHLADHPAVRYVIATGDWSMSQIATELEIRGLTQRPTAKRPAAAH